MAKKKGEFKTDFSSFMCVILMLTGCLVTIMISNVVVISANPENVQITSILPSTGAGAEKEIYDPKGNVIKNPWYVEVWRDRLIIHPGSVEVALRELESRENRFERFLRKIEAVKHREYIVLLVRENAGSVARKLKKVIRDRQIDTGMDLLKGADPVVLRIINTNQLAELEAIVSG